MKKRKHFLIVMLLFFATGFGFSFPGMLMAATHDAPTVDPSLTGPTSVCLNSTGNVYTTDAGQTGYVWTVNGGTITTGGSSSDNTATVTWTAAGSKTISVTYAGATTTVLPVTVNPLTSSISISASSTNVFAGSPVTFTATAVNPGSSPTYEWKVNGNNAGTNSPTFIHTPMNGDAVYCLLTPNAPCVTSTFTSNVITITVTTQPLLITTSTLHATPGSVLYFPVKLKGASSSGTPVSGATIEITYDPAVLTFDSLMGFYPSMPLSQWFYSGANGVITANWQHPTLGTTSVPDSTTLFSLQFHYNGGFSALPFTIYDFTDAQYNLITTNIVNGAVNQIPVLTGPVNVCQGTAGNIYTTDAGQSNYTWVVTGGTITAGGTSSDHTATVTWNTPGSQSLSVSYQGSAVTTLPVTVNPSLPVSVSISASANPVCATTSVTFTATPTNGGTNPAYQWKKNGSTISGATAATYTYVPVNNDVISCVLTSNEVCTTGNPATSNDVTMTVNPLTAGISISVAPSNNVTIGTPVTFTATTTNGGPSPTFMWKVNGNDAGTNSPTFTYTPANGDAVYCILASNAPCVTALFTSNVITMTVTYPAGSLLVTLPNKKANPGDIVYCDVKLKGASSSGTPISACTIEVSYDPAVLQYNGLVNFYSGLPESQWYYAGGNGLVSANWQHPSLATVVVPDSTTLYQLQFTYVGGNSALNYTTYDFTDAYYQLVLTNHVNGSVSPNVPTNLTVQNETVGTGQSNCYNAQQVITVAGSGSGFVVNNGGSATFIAGQAIYFMPGTTVNYGGYLIGRITTNGQYCGGSDASIVTAQTAPADITSVPEISGGSKIRVYPNPTEGHFTVEIMNAGSEGMTGVDIVTMSGSNVLSKDLDHVKKQEFSVKGLAPGIYFIRVTMPGSSEVLKIVKL